MVCGLDSILRDKLRIAFCSLLAHSFIYVFISLLNGKKNLSVNAGDARDKGSIPGSGRSSGGGNGNTLQYSYLENPMDRGTWWVVVHKVVKRLTRLSELTHTYILIVFIF